MTLLLPTLAVAFGAFCVWLTVRIVNRRERWAKWTAVVVIGVIGLPVLYAASFGPATWLDSRGFIPHSLFSVVYEPLNTFPFNAPPLNRLSGHSYELFGFTIDGSGPVSINRTPK